MKSGWKEPGDRSMDNKKVRIMFFVCGVKSGGVEQMLINYCSRMNQQKYDFILIYQHEAVKPCLEKMVEAGFITERITARCENPLKHVVDTYRVIRKYRPEIIHSNMNLMNFVPNIIGKFCGVKVRISHSHIAEKNLNLSHKILLSICRFLIVRSSTRFLACGEDAGRYLHGNRIHSEIIRNAIDLESFRHPVGQFLSEKESNKFVIGHVGRFSIQKNHKRLIEIFNEYLKINPNSLLILAGTGELEYKIKRYVADLKIEEKIKFCGAIKDMPSFYASLDMFLFPSLWEGFPVIALEVQAAGVKAIFSDKIDSQVKVTSLISFMSLDKGDIAWAHEIERMRILPQNDDEDFVNELTQAGYDIKFEVTRLEQFYLSCENM